MTECNFVWLNGVFSSKTSKLFEYTVPSHELLFSFEKIKISNEYLSDLESYIDIVSSKLKANLVETLFTLNDIKAACKELLKKNCIENGHLKIYVLKNSKGRRFPNILIDCWQ